MLQELLGKTVTVYLGVVSNFTDSLKGEVVDVNDTWLKLQTKKNIELINVEKIGRISTK